MDIRIEDLPLLSNPLTGNEEVVVEFDNDNYKVSLNTISRNNIEYIYPQLLSYRIEDGINVEIFGINILANEVRYFFITNYDTFVKHTLTAINGTVNFDLNNEQLIIYTAPSEPGPCGFIIDNRTVNLTVTVPDVPEGNYCYKINDPNPSSNNQFGYSITMDADSSLIAISSARSNYYDSGYVYIFQLEDTSSNPTWNLLTTIESPLYPSLTAFGSSISFNEDGSVLAVGDYEYYEVSRDVVCGAVHIYMRNELTSEYAYHSTLLPNDFKENGRFGYSIKASTNKLVIGSPGFNSASAESPRNETGCVYVFENNFTTGYVQKAKLFGVNPTGDDHLGFSVSIANQRIAASAINNSSDGITNSGCVYVYVFGIVSDIPDPFWHFEAKLLAEDKNFNDELGWSVDIDNDYFVVASTRQKNTGDLTNNGGVYVFVYDAGWFQLDYITPSDSTIVDNFGISVSLTKFNEASALMVGANLRSVDGLSLAGSTYCYLITQDATTEHSIYIASDQVLNSFDYHAFDLFGSSVFMSRHYNSFASSAIEYDMESNSNTGAVYICPTTTRLTYGGA